MNKVAITGMGIVTSSANNISEFKSAIFEGKTNFKKNVIEPLSFPVIRAPLGKLTIDHNKIFQLEHNHSEKRKNHLEKLFKKCPWHIQASIVAACEALDTMNFNRERSGIIVAAQNESSHLQYDLYKSFLETPEYLSPNYALNFMDTAQVAVLSDIFNILGEGFVVGGASASGNVALIRAHQLICDGVLDTCLVVGSVADLSPMDIQGFYNIGALGGQHFLDDPNKASRPFDKKSDGFIYGQAAACLILESEKLAKNRNAPILGYMLGGALVMDGNYLADSSEDGEVRAMQQAMKNSQVEMNQINYINTHGSSAPLGDAVEIKAIEKVFANNLNEILINSTKSITGHCLWSAGVVEAIATILQLQEGVVHANLNLENPISEKCRLVKENQKADIKFALSNSFGFGGINSAVVFSA